MKQTFLLAFAVISSMLSAQSVPMALEDWKTTQGTQNFFYKNVTKTDALGNVFVAGATMNNGVPDMLIAKYNGSGNLQWIQQFAGTASNGVDAITGLYINGSDVYITGAISNNSVTPETDCYTAKLASATGSVVWSATYSGAAGGHDSGKDIALDGSGNVYVSGASHNSSFNTDYLAIKYNSSGTQQWASVWDHANADDGGYKIALSGSNVNVSGAVTTATTSTYKMATVRFSQSAGSLLATTVSTAVTTTSVEAVTDMALDGSGNIIIVGSQYTGGQHDFYVQKLNAATLASVFVYTWDGGSSLNDFAKAVATDASGNVYVSGYSSSSTLGRELTLIKLNGSGSHQWTQTSGLSGDDEGVDLVVDGSNEVYVGGYRTNATKDYYTAKYNSSGGTKVWEIQADGNSGLDDHVTNIALDSLNNVIVTGQSQTGSGDYEFLTVKYVQRDVLIPIDLNSEPANSGYQYYSNLGQVTTYSGTPTPLVKHYTNSFNPKIYLNPTINYFVYASGDTLQSTTDSIVRIDLSFAGSNASAESYAYEETEGYVNYFLSNLPEPITNLKGKNRILVPNLYPNIDLQVYNNENGIKYYFILKPGSTLSDINFNFSGANTTTLVSNSIDVDCHLKHLVFTRPKVYQIDGTPTIINAGNGSWRSTGTDTYGIVTSVTTNTALSIVIMIETNQTTTSVAAGNIQWSTFFGDGTVTDLRVNKNNGKQYLTGSTSSSTFPAFSGLNTAISYVGLPDVFIAQFKNNNARDWVTYYGGTGNVNSYYENADFGTGIDYDNQGNVYVIGNTWSDSIPTKKSSDVSAFFISKAPQPGPDNNRDIFFLKMDSTGGVTNGNVEWCTYLGGNPKEESGKILVAGNYIYMIGAGGSAGGSYPTPLQYKNGAYNQGSLGKCQIYKFTKDCVYDWGTNFDNPVSAGFMTLNGLDWDNSSGLTVTGYSESSNLFTTTAGANIPYRGGAGLQKGDAYWTLFDSNDDIKYSTFIGGTNYDEGFDVVIDGGVSYIVGQTNATTTQVFPYKYAPGQYIDSTYNGANDGFMAAFRNSTGTLNWSTYYGGSNNDYINAVCSDNLGGVYIHGTTTSSNLYIPAGGPGGLYNQSSSGSADETFIGRLVTASVDFDWISYFGGANADYDVKIACHKNKSLYITGAGSIAGNTFPTNPNIVGTSYFSTNGTIYLSRFDLNPFYVGLNDIPYHPNEMIVYPNPAKDLLYVKGNAIFTKLEIYNTMGQKVLENSNANSINIMNLATGVYILRASSKDEYKSVKIVKE